MPRPPRLDLLHRLLLLTLERPLAINLHLHQRVVDRQHDDGRPGYDAEHRDGSDGAELLDPGLLRVERGAAEESGGGDCGGEKCVLWISTC